MKKRLICAVIAVLTVINCFSMVSCDSSGNSEIKVKSKVYYDYFDTVSSVYDYAGKGEMEFDSICSDIENMLKYYHSLFDIYHSYQGVTGLYEINAKAGKGPVVCDEAMIDFLEYCKYIYELTDGYVNVAMGAVLVLWHETRQAGIYDPENARIPTDAELKEAAKHCDIDKLVINREDMTVELLDPDMRLDVGAIAKGYATEKIAQHLKSYGLSGFVLDIGGNLRAIGTKPNGEGWTTGVKNPDAFSDTKYIHKFSLADASAVTSGDYERYYTVNGKRYNHIISKDTLMPAEKFTSVTIVTESSALADGLSTALFCMDYEQGRALINSLEGTSAIWVTKDGTVLN